MRVVEVDIADDSTIERFVDYMNEHRPASRIRSVGRIRGMQGWCRHVGAFAAVGDAGEWLGVAETSVQDVDGGQCAHLQAAFRTPVPDIETVRALTAHVAGWLDDTSATALLAHIADPIDAELEIWHAGGFVRAGARTGWSLDITGLSEIPDLPDVHGIRVVPLASEPELEPSAFEAWFDAYGAIPDENLAAIELTLEAWRTEMRSVGGGEIPPGLLVAVTDDGVVAGVGMLMPEADSPGIAHHRFTGVAGAFRGRGIARLLKVAQIRWAAERGLTQLRASNHTTNPSMLHINESLGYRAERTIVQLRRDVRRSGSPRPRPGR